MPYFAFVSTNAVLPKTKLRTTKVYGYFANKQVCKNKRLPCVKGAVAKRLRDCFSVNLIFYNPSVTASRATSLYTREAFLPSGR